MTPLAMRYKHWIPELLALAGSMLSFAMIIVLLSIFDKRSVFTWNGLTLNTIVSILSLAMKSSSAFNLAECTAQWKWILFARQSRPLIDFDRIDAATRGPLGSLRILMKTKDDRWVTLLIDRWTRTRENKDKIY